MRGVCVLGATGSVGRSTLDVLGRHPEQFRIEALTAHTDVQGMEVLIRQHQPGLAVMADAQAARQLAERTADLPVRVLGGPEALAEAASLPEVDTVMAAIVGASGLPSTLAAAQAGKRLLLATKEALVTAGELLLRAVEEGGGSILPIDSEHNAIFQCLPADSACGRAPAGVQRLILTASGGPFRDWTWEQMQAATPAQAVAHPNWDMGRKISVDSATMMNKGLELIEAAYLYAMPESAIEVLVHRQSIVHSLVQYQDGSFLAQLGSADMRIPIAHALLHPQRGESGAQTLDLAQIARLDFEAPDERRFPALRLAREALRGGAHLPAVFNAANEQAVDAFLDGRIGFTAIPAVVESVLESAAAWEASEQSLEAVLSVDARARAAAHALEARH